MRLSINLDMAKTHVKVTLDTNLLVSAFVFGGKPEAILNLVFEKQIQVFSSPVLLSELYEVLNKKFYFDIKRINFLDRKLNEEFIIVHPLETIDILKDKDDNRVLEAAIEGNCQYIVTGDQGLLELGNFRKIKIITASELLGFLS